MPSFKADAVFNGKDNIEKVAQEIIENKKETSQIKLSSPFLLLKV